MSKPRELWVDLSTSVRWEGGVIGIVRAELELARAMRVLHPATRFCAFNGEAFVEMQHERINWIFESRSVADAYLKVRDYFRAAADYRQPQRGPQTIEYPRYREMLAQLPPVAENRMGQLRMSLLFGATAIPASELLLKGMLRLYEPLRGKMAPKSSKVGQGNGGDPVRSEEWSLPVGAPPARAPFTANSTVVCAGWMDTGREKHLAAIKAANPGLCIAQLIYDVIPIHEDLAHLYPESGSLRFASYFSWVAKNADVVFTGGENTAKDVATYQRKLNLPMPRAVPVRFGDAKLAEELQYDPVRDYYPDDGTLLRMLRIAKPFVLCVGTVEARKNHAVLYEAMRLLFDRHGVNTPLMVFAGIPDARTRDLMDSVARDPKTSDHILHIVPTDHQLQVAYRNAAFTVLPSLYEGWSLTLPESLSFGKFALVSDVPPLKEIGADRVEYLPPHEPHRWADRIEHYLDHPDELAQREAHIKATWKQNTWTDCAQTMLTALEGLS
jgi:glycosyltransferase involved in cell wall biosynthesis